MKTCVIFNPAARGTKADRFRQHLSALADECALKPTRSAGDGRHLAAEAAREGFEIVVAAGGDGTLNEVLNGIAEVDGGLERVRLGVLPLGTVNVFAKELAVPSRFDRAWEIIRRGKDIRIDLPRVQFEVGGRQQRRYFAQMAGAGVDSRAVELVNWEHKKRWGQVAYWIAGFKALAELKPQLVASTDSKSEAGEVILVGNGRFYGGRYPLFPLADLCDGLLEVTIFRRVNMVALLHGGWGLLTNRLHATRGIRHFRTESLRLCSESAVPFHVEGENVGHLPVTFSLERQRLRVVVP